MYFRFWEEVALYPTSGGKKIMTEEGKMLGKIFAKMECLRQQSSYGAMVRNHNQERQKSPYCSADKQMAVYRGFPMASNFKTDENK